MTDRTWMDQAVCAQVDPEIFFPETGGNYRDADTVCAGCPVRQQCIDYAQTVERGLSYSYRHGSWGGTTPRERADAAAQSVAEVRDETIIRLADRRWSAEDIAAAVNCHARTVWRVLDARQTALGEAA